MHRFIKDVKRYMEYAKYAAKAELKAEVAGSYLNWIWWILEPICLMLIYSFIFGFVFDAREKYFTAFIYIGLTVWTFFNQCLKSSVKMVKKNKSVVSKIYIPKFVLPETKMMVNGFKMMVSFGIIALLIIGYRIRLTINLIYIIPLLLCLFLLTFGMMCILVHFGVFVEDLSNVVTIVLRLVFYMTGIMYSIEKRVGVKNPVLGKILGNYNPMAYIITSFRKCIIYGQAPDIKFLLLWLTVGVGLTVVGVSLIYKNENSYVKVI